MNADERDRLRRIVAEQLGLDAGDVTIDTNLSDLMDSLDSIEIQLEVEDAFGIDRIEDGDMDRVTTFGDLIQLVANLKQPA
jgi:acyl carrier protein